MRLIVRFIGDPNGYVIDSEEQFVHFVPGAPDSWARATTGPDQVWINLDQAYCIEKTRDQAPA